MKARAKREKEGGDWFSQTVHPYAAAMRRFCISLTGSAWDGEDLFQIVMEKTYRAWLNNPSRPITKAFLYRIISNAWIDRHRKRSVNEKMKESFENVADHATTEKIDEQLAQAMQQLIDRLRPKQRLIFLMLAGWGLTPAEAADATGESEGNIRVIYHRARKLLRNGTLYSEQVGELADRYVDAFQSGKTEKLIQLYQEEIHAPLRPARIQMVGKTSDFRNTIPFRLFLRHMNTSGCRTAA